MSRLTVRDILIPLSGRVPQALDMVARDAPAADWARLSSPELMAREPCLVHESDNLSTALVVLPDVMDFFSQCMQALAGSDNLSTALAGSGASSSSSDDVRYN